MPSIGVGRIRFWTAMAVSSVHHALMRRGQGGTWTSARRSRQSPECQCPLGLGELPRWTTHRPAKNAKRKKEVKRREQYRLVP
jgi:hypothetical protein